MIEKRGLLPKVDDKGVDKFMEEFKSERRYLTFICSEMFKENPFVAHFLANFPSVTISPKCSGALIYRLLRNSGELPIIGEDASISFYYELSSLDNLKKQENHFGLLERQIHDENYYAFFFLKRFAQNQPEKIPSYQAGILTYRFLEIQAEIDWNKKRIINDGLNQDLPRKFYPDDKSSYPLTWLARQRLNLALNQEDFPLAAYLRDAINSSQEPLKRNV